MGKGLGLGWVDRKLTSHAQIFLAFGYLTLPPPLPFFYLPQAKDYGTMSRMVREALGDRVVLGLEGGYSLDPDGVSEAVAETVKAFARTTDVESR